MRRLILGLVAGLAAGACQEPTNPHVGRSGAVFVYAAAPELHLNSTDTRPVFYAVYQTGFLATANFSSLLCVQPGCSSVASGGQVVIPYDRIPGYEPPGANVVEQEVLIVLAHSIPAANGGFRPDTMQSILIKL